MNDKDPGLVTSLYKEGFSEPIFGSVPDNTFNPQDLESIKPNEGQDTWTDKNSASGQ